MFYESDLTLAERNTFETLTEYGFNPKWHEISAGFNENEQCLITYKDKTIGHVTWDHSDSTMTTYVINKRRINKWKV